MFLKSGWMVHVLRKSLRQSTIEESTFILLGDLRD